MVDKTYNCVLINNSYMNNLSNSGSPQNCSLGNIKTKRDCKKNVLLREQELLLQICSEFLDIIENKKTDSLSCKKKSDVWIEITKKFNAVQTSGTRTDKYLKTLYDNIKRDGKQLKNCQKLLECSSNHNEAGSSLCNLLKRGSADKYEPGDYYECSPNLLSEGSEHLSDSSEIRYERLNIKEEPCVTGSKAVHPLSSCSSSMDSSTSDSNSSANQDCSKAKNNNFCELHSTTSESYHSEEYHQTRLKYLEIEHKKKMEILNLKQECLFIKREYLKAKLGALTKIGVLNDEVNNL